MPGTPQTLESVNEGDFYARVGKWLEEMEGVIATARKDEANDPGRCPCCGRGDGPTQVMRLRPVASNGGNGKHPAPAGSRLPSFRALPLTLMVVGAVIVVARLLEDGL